MTWRDMIRPIVADVISRVGLDDPKALRRALLDARPIEVLTCSWQAKIWRDEVRQQTGIKSKLIAAKKRAADVQRGQQFFIFKQEQPND